MNKPIIIHTIAVALVCGTGFADGQKREVVVSEVKTGNARADARAFSSTTTTIQNGRPVTIIEDLDENGKKRLRMITYETGKPKMKDITPKEKPAPKEDTFWKKKPAGDAKKPAEDAK